MRDKFMSSRLYIEVKANPRLQWMLLVVAVILLSSLSKSVFDNISEERASITQQFLMVEKLKVAANKTVDLDALEALEAEVSKLSSNIPSSGSMNVAEAEALKLSAESFSKIVTSSSISLIGSEPMFIGDTEYWQVRIQVTGRLPEKSFISFLSNFDGKKSYVRLNSLEYIPQSGDRINAVIDYLYKKAA